MIPSAEDIVEALNKYRIKFVEIEEGYELQITKEVSN